MIQLVKSGLRAGHVKMAVPPAPAVCGQQLTGKKHTAFKGTGPVRMFTTCAPVISSLRVADEVTQHIFWGVGLFRMTFISVALVSGFIASPNDTFDGTVPVKGPVFPAPVVDTLCVNLIGLSVIGPGETGRVLKLEWYLFTVTNEREPKVDKASVGLQYFLRLTKSE